NSRLSDHSTIFFTFKNNLSPPSNMLNNPYEHDNTKYQTPPRINYKKVSDHHWKKFKEQVVEKHNMLFDPNIKFKSILSEINYRNDQIEQAIKLTSDTIDRNISNYLIGSTSQLLNLQRCKFLLQSYNSFNIYSDGSVLHPNSNNTKMGFGWIALTTNNIPITEFSGSTKNFASSTKAEAFAIFTAIISSSPNSNINI